MGTVDDLIAETLARYLPPPARPARVAPRPMGADERGWSGAEIRRYAVVLEDGRALTVLTKTMPLVERRAMDLLSRQGHAHTPFAYARDLTTDAPALACMEDVGRRKVGIPTGDDAAPPSPAVDRRVARGLAAIHAHNLGQPALRAWLPPADPAYVGGFLLPEVWRAHWDRALAADPAFAREFAPYTPRLEAASARFARAMAALWAEGSALTLTHGEVHGEHVLLRRGRPYLIDWGWAHYGPFYLDLPAYFTPHTVHLYRDALHAAGVDVPEADFLERYHEVGRYVGFKYLCTGVWQWPPGPTAATGHRLLLTLKWAIDGTWPERAFAVPEAAWRTLLARHARGASL